MFLQGQLRWSGLGSGAAVMVGHWESSIFHPPSDKSKRRRDIFPLPTIADESVSNASLSRAVRRRLEARSSVNKRVNLAVNSLNSMWFGGSSKYTKWEVSSLSGLPACQRDAMQNILQCVKCMGAPLEASCHGALCALRAAGSAYEDGADIGVGSVVNMELSKLSLPSGGVAGVSLVDSLEGTTKNMVEDFENFMLQDADAWTFIEDESCKVPPYNDQLLSTRKGYLTFLRRLFDAGVLGHTSRCRGRVGAFCVSKKSKIIDGVEHKRQRLVLDCRQTNLQFREPPMTELGSLASLGNLQLPEGKKLYVATADIRDCFYAVNCPIGMSDFFCLRSDITPAEAIFISNGAWSIEDNTPFVSPCITVLPMGFSWSFYLIQVLHEQATMKALGIPRSSLILEGQPAPDVDDKSCLAMPYCDNVHTMSTDPRVCQVGCDDVQEKLTSMGFDLHEETEASTYCCTLGGSLMGTKGK